MPDVLFFLILGHIFGDFAFQTDYMAQNKGSDKKVLSLHVLVYVITVGMFWWIGAALGGDKTFPDAFAGIILATLYLQHWLQDFIKSNKTNGGKHAFFVDQAAHLAVLYIIRIVH
jgi:hypothetical protein